MASAPSIPPPKPGRSSPQTDVEKSTPKKPALVTWASLPHKGQLAILALVRVVDFFQVASLQAYMFHQLKSFDPSLPDSTISFQTGVLQGVFTSAQVVTAIIWGRVADAPWAGRKFVILIGLIGTGLSCVGVGYSKSFAAAAVFRMLGGASNGTVGATRTALAETVEKRYHPRAFLLLPLAFNIANILGPSTYHAL
jgi:MFS family permease